MSLLNGNNLFLPGTAVWAGGCPLTPGIKVESLSLSGEPGVRSDSLLSWEVVGEPCPDVHVWGVGFPGRCVTGHLGPLSV